MKKKPVVKPENEGLLTDAVLNRLKKEAQDAIDKHDLQAFFLAEKKIMLIGIAYVVRYMSTMSKKKKKADMGHVREALLGTLYTIQMLDKNLPDVDERESEDGA